MTTRERRERKAERLREWAGKRETKADEAYAASRAATEHIPFGQPILVGHHSEKGHRRDIDRSCRAMDRMVEHGAKAREMAERADNIEAQNRRAIYSDDSDAAERLAEKIAKLEQQRSEIKAHNKANPDKRTPSYVLTNLGANIRRLQKRADELSAPEAGRWLDVRYGGECRKCGAMIERGDRAMYYKRSKSLACEGCAS